jgi:hypothetical protein
VAQMDDGQMGDNINSMKVCRFESCPDCKSNQLKTKQMKLNQNSLSAKLYRWFYKTDTMPTNLCPYFWKLVTAVILSPLLAIYTLPYEIINYKRSRWDPYDDMLGISFVYWAIITAVICMISTLGLFFYIPNKSSLLWVMMAVGFCLWSCLILVGITWAIVKTVVYLESKKSDDEKTDNIVVEMVKAKYHKYCPKINWK